MPRGEMLSVIQPVQLVQQESIHVNEFEEIHEECGVFGFQFSNSIQNETPGVSVDLPKILFKGMHENQHRGETSAGIAVVHEGEIYAYKDLGLVSKLYNTYTELVRERDFSDEETNNPLIENLMGYGGVGHVRYPTTGTKTREGVKKKDKEESLLDAGPFISYSEFLGPIAVAHNGNITNAEKLKAELREKGYLLNAKTDSEVISALIADAPGKTWEEKMQNALPRLKGSFSLVMKTLDGLYAARDASGNKPLYMTTTKNGVAFSSETPALRKLDPTKKRFEEVSSGAIIKYDGEIVSKLKFTDTTERNICAVDLMYVQRVDNQGVDKVRRTQGAMLAREFPMESGKKYIVTYLPNSAQVFAEAYQQELSNQLGEFVPLKTSLLKNRYGKLNGDNRGFIQPEQKDREAMAEDNYYTLDWLRDLLEEAPEGTELIILEDSIVRGTTLKGAIAQYRRFIGKTPIHLRIALPPVKHDCHFGVDIAISQGLVFREKGTKEKVADFLGVTSLEYSTVEQLEESVHIAYGSEQCLCKGCMTGEYSKTISELPSEGASAA